eukprot:TRINITY_DN1812_c0_g1_i8.p2 TRINITY_DN1812_c0_g1~~TRINITY_DN1812_c0_g1_i8.p2  ORF type:complete len:597 (+),score=206.17 TRINITY_DN1812_c0_g1_i8:77-1792(+)
MRRSLALLLCGAAGAEAAACLTPAGDRTDCGFSGIDQVGCERKGCCWGPLDPNPGNAPWCYVASSTAPPGPAPPVPPGTTCALPDAVKEDCEEMAESGCESKGCCWTPVEPNPANVPWCYRPAVPPPPTPVPTPMPPLPPGSKPFSDDELATMRGFFFKNIDLFGTGMVVAAPDNNTKGGTYWFHWMRDGGLTMRSVLSNFDWSVADPKMRSYVRHVVQAQAEQDPHGLDVRGEPKFMIPSGAVFPGGWCRPQNDGAGIRGGTLGLYALALLERNQTDYVRQYLWTGGSASHGGLVKYDLDYCVAVWDQQGCDLWEEVRSDDFFWQWANARRGLLVGAELAARLGDAQAAAKYRSAAAAIAAKMANHTQVGARGAFIYETACCSRQKDVAALLGVLHDDPDQPVFSLSGAEVANTVATLDDVFTAMFPINSAGAKLWGRYEGDGYAGGNPWVLACLGKAQVLYRAATGLLKSSSSAAPAELVAAWGQAVPAAAQAQSRTDLAGTLAAAADQVMVRVRGLVGELGFHLPEQLDKTTGARANVHDLTWSYAALFDALAHRGKYTAALSAGSAR